MLSISMVPRRASMLRLTTSMPTPRPERLVIAAAVEKPGAKIICSSSPSPMVAPGAISPCASALARTRARLMPRPSSWMAISTSPPACRADSTMRPAAGLPAGARSSAGSRPWSQLLRITWIIGSARRSITVLSTSVASPSVTSSMVLPVSCARSWINRRNRPNRLETGIIRSAIEVSRSSADSRWISSETARRVIASIVPAAAISSSRLCAMTSSPTRFISSSSRSACTRTLSCAGAVWRAAARGASVGAAAVSATPAEGSGASDVISSSMSSITKTNTSSMSSRLMSPASVTSHTAWHSVGSRSASAGTSSNRQVTVQSPRSRNSSSRPSGLEPVTIASGGRRKRTCQPLATAGVGAAAAGASLTALASAARMPSPAATSAASASDPASSSDCM